ncbi:MAG: SMP-30/gluconolactonase/LRE family protein [Pelomonas sp.]|nr:SMP-30/gluconolactonase/LRE family protein [Roseateles sp.]
MSTAPLFEVTLAHPEPSLLGESPLWDAAAGCLYHVDIPGKELRRLDPASGALARWPLPDEPGCIALIEGDPTGLLVAGRAGLARFDTASGALTPLAPPPFDPARQRFNDGKPDAAGRFWVGTIDDARAPDAALYRFDANGVTRVADGITTSNGLAWSPDGRRLYWTDTKAHEIYALDFDARDGSVGPRRRLAAFEPRAAGAPLETYGGRPDGAAVDVEGCYWVALFEGQRLLRLAPDGSVRRELRLPVRCPTMPTFGGPDLRTLFVTTARNGRPSEELDAQPWAGCVLRIEVDVPGLPAAAARLPFG